MGQNQLRVDEGGKQSQEGKSHISQPLKDRRGAKFGNEHDVNPSYAKGGKGGSGNPGIPS